MTQTRCYFLAACCLLLVCAVDSNVLVKLTDDKLTKDIEVPHDLAEDVDQQVLTKLTNELDNAEPDKKCAAVGQFVSIISNI